MVPFLTNADPDEKRSSGEMTGNWVFQRSSGPADLANQRRYRTPM